MAAVTYYTASGQPAWSTATPVSLPTWDQPFPELTDRLVFRQRFMVGASYYSPVAPNTAYDYPGVFTVGVVPTSVCYYLVAEENMSDQRAGLIEFDRVYATVPTTRREYTSIVYHYPAVITNISTGSYVGVTFAQAIGASRMFITTSLTANPGEQVALSYSYAGVSYGNVPVAVLDYATDGLITEENTNFIGTTYVRQVARAYRSAGRLYAKDLPGRAVIEYNYALVTPNVTPVFTPSVRQKFTTVDGMEVDYVSNQTTPTSASYSQWVTAGTFFIAEDDQWSRWLGNIYELRTLRVVAQ